MPTKRLMLTKNVSQRIETRLNESVHQIKEFAHSKLCVGEEIFRQWLGGTLPIPTSQLWIICKELQLNPQEWNDHWEELFKTLSDTILAWRLLRDEIEEYGGLLSFLVGNEWVLEQIVKNLHLTPLPIHTTNLKIVRVSQESDRIIRMLPTTTQAIVTISQPFFDLGHLDIARVLITHENRVLTPLLTNEKSSIRSLDSCSFLLPCCDQEFIMISSDDPFVVADVDADDSALTLPVIKSPHDLFTL